MFSLPLVARWGQGGGQSGDYRAADFAALRELTSLVDVSSYDLDLGASRRSSPFYQNLTGLSVLLPFGDNQGVYLIAPGSGVGFWNLTRRSDLAHDGQVHFAQIAVREGIANAGIWQIDGTSLATLVCRPVAGKCADLPTISKAQVALPSLAVNRGDTLTDLKLQLIAKGALMPNQLIEDSQRGTWNVLADWEDPEGQNYDLQRTAPVSLTAVDTAPDPVLRVVASVWRDTEVLKVRDFCPLSADLSPTKAIYAATLFWFTTGNPTTITASGQIIAWDPFERRIVAEFAAGGLIGYFEVGEDGLLYALVNDVGHCVVIDPIAMTSTIVPLNALGSTPQSGICQAFGDLWVSCLDGTVKRANKITGALIASVAMPPGYGNAQGLRAANGKLYAAVVGVNATIDQGIVAVINPATNTVVSHVQVGICPTTLLSYGGRVYCTLYFGFLEGACLAVIDDTTDALLYRRSGSFGSTSMAVTPQGMLLAYQSDAQQIAIYDTRKADAYVDYLNVGTFGHGLACGAGVVALADNGDYPVGASGYKGAGIYLIPYGSAELREIVFTSPEYFGVVDAVPNSDATVRAGLSQLPLGDSAEEPLAFVATTQYVTRAYPAQKGQATYRLGPNGISQNITTTHVNVTTPHGLVRSYAVDASDSVTASSGLVQLVDRLPKGIGAYDPEQQGDLLFELFAEYGVTIGFAGVTAWAPLRGNVSWTATNTTGSGYFLKFESGAGPNSLAHLRRPAWRAPSVLDLPSLAALTEGEMFIVFKRDIDPPTDVNGGGAGLFGMGTAANSSLIPYTDGKVYDDFGCATRRATGASTAGATANWCIYNVSSAAADWRCLLNNTLLYNNAVNVVTFPVLPVLGQGIANSGINLIGSIGHVLFYSKKRTTAQRNAICRQYLGPTWGITVA